MKFLKAKRTAERRARILFLVERVRSTITPDEPITKQHPTSGICVAFGKYYYLVTWSVDFEKARAASEQA
jgi:hypothetical protein